jgi:SAM-dependent methyltransferase
MPNFAAAAASPPSPRTGRRRGCVLAAVTLTTDYALQLSDEEEARYRMMAEKAAAEEQPDWDAAGITGGARIADVGCGPGAMLSVLAGIVGPSGSAVGVDRDPAAVALARGAVAHLPQASVQVGDADATGLAAGAFDVAVCRHVLAHNGGREQAVVDHLATLVRPGGAVYLVDVDMTGTRLVPKDPALDIDDAYRTFHARRGNDLTIGLRLGALLEDAGLAVERYRCASSVWSMPIGVRGPQWAAREAMVADGVATGADLARWDAAYEWMDQAPNRPWMFVPLFVAVGRRAGS